MSEAFVVERDFLFKDSIFEITSISVEHDEDINGSNLEGDFIISGDYRLHEISINKEDFSFKLPFTHEIRSNVNLDTVNLEITDFTYELNNNDELHVHIEYIVSGEQSLIEFADEKDLDEFLNKLEKVIVDSTKILDKGRYCAIVIGDMYKDSQVIPLGFYCMQLFMKNKLKLKAILVKNFNETKGKQNQQALWHYRALKNNLYLFKHEYIFVFKK